jgi:hypothetical protein
MKNLLNRWHLAVAAALLLCVLCLSGAGRTPPDRSPSRIILTWSDDPTRTQSVTWRTETPVNTPQAQIARLVANPNFGKTAATVPGTGAIDDIAEGRTAGHYAANFQGLEPSTKYCYRVGDGTVWSEWNVFRTAALKPEAFRFIYLGDAQNSIRSLWARAVRTAYATAPDARFVVHAGDLVAEGYDDSLWGEWSDAMGFISATIPSLPVPGNHDLHRPPGSPDAGNVFGASPLWRRHFALPANGPAIEEMPSQSYYLDYQGVRFVALDVNVFANEDFQANAKKRVWDQELAWIEKVLSTNPNRWTVLIQHQAIFAVANGREYKEMRDALAPLYEKYKVDLVLQGHDHAYARSHKIAGGRIVNRSAPGVIYAISVSGPKMYETHQLHRELMAIEVEQKQMFQIVEVAPDRLLYSARSVDGELIDEFELRRGAAAASGSVYVNRVPAR